MKIRFWTSTEYRGFLEGLMRELSTQGYEAKQCYQISEDSYRSAKSAPARLFLRFRQYVVYPAQLCWVLLADRVKRFAHAIANDRVKASPTPGTTDPAPFSSESDSAPLSPDHWPLSSGLRPLAPGLCAAGTCDSVAVVSTNTFYAPLLATFLYPNVVHLVYDLFPEAMIHSGKWMEGTLKVKIIRWITKQTLRRAKINVFLGERLKHYVESIHGPVPNSAIIAVGADQSLFGRSPKERQRAEGGGQGKEGQGTEGQGTEEGSEVQRRTSNVERPTLNVGSDTAAEEPMRRLAIPRPTILYCGNFGNMHDSQTLFDFWKRSSDVLQPSSSGRDAQPSALSHPPSGIHWSFYCSGPKRAALEAELLHLPDVLKKQIQLGGGLGQDAWIAAMEQADVALVTMVPGSETVVMPSKTYSAMMAGQAILAIAPEDSDLVDLIKAADCGWWAAPGDVNGLATIIERISADSECLLEKRAHAYQYAHAHLGQDALAKQWMRVLGACAGRTAVQPRGDDRRVHGSD